MYGSRILRVGAEKGWLRVEKKTIQLSHTSMVIS